MKPGEAGDRPYSPFDGSQIMTTTGTNALGRCPECDAEIPASRILIEYETAEGTEAFAECPGCLDVVHPR